MKKIIFLVLIFALGAGFYATYLKYMEHNSGEMEFYGNVDTKVVNLSFRFLGQIERIAKREGQAVKKGEELVFMESSYLNNTILNLTSQIAQQEANLAKLKKGYRSEQIDQAKASVEVARATLKSAENTYKRQSELIKKSATSQEVYINSQANYENAKANLALQNANYEQMKNGYEKEDIDVKQEVINALKIQLE
ncbi:MAG: secretion protein HlyD, partial [Campylobacter sp.]|nr:secretion protein HlyD [Campylobacter sp.]